MQDILLKYGTVELLKQYAKDQLNLKKLTLEVFPFNERAIKVYTKLGFKSDGVAKFIKKYIKRECE